MPCAAAGIVAAVKGHVLPNGDFEVSDICFAGVPPQPPRPSIGQAKCVCVGFLAYGLLVLVNGLLLLRAGMLGHLLSMLRQQVLSHLAWCRPHAKGEMPRPASLPAVAAAACCCSMSHMVHEQLPCLADAAAGT